MFDDSKGEARRFSPRRVVPGFGEGLQMMNKGAKYVLYIPGDLAYGVKGMPQAGIGPNQLLIFDVEIADICLLYTSYTGNPQKGLEILENVDFKGSDFLHCSVVRERANAFRQMGDFESAIGELKVLQNIRGNLSSHEWSKMGRYLCEIKDYRNAAVALDSAKLYAETRNDSLFVKYVTALIPVSYTHLEWW